jgi:hypothetical protein
MAAASAAEDVVATPAVAAVNNLPPLAAALLQKGLSEEQMVQDNWTALLSLPPDVVTALTAAPGTLTGAHRAARERHATLDVLQVTPSSPLSCEMWCQSVAGFASGIFGRELLGTAAVRDALVALRPQATTAFACQWWCTAICDLTVNNAANKSLLRVDSVRQAHAALEEIAAMIPETKTSWDNAAVVLR